MSCIQTPGLVSASLVPALCPVCHYTLAAPFFDGGQQPLATLGWPRSTDEAVAMPRYPLDFVQCPCCAHVWNRSFRYDAIPYQANPNRMFNTGAIWSEHLTMVRDLIFAQLPSVPTVVEVGCGDGGFLSALASTRRSGRFIGFDPNSSGDGRSGLDFFGRYFEPLVDMAVLAPDIVIMRHVLEHLTDPASFVEQLAWGASDLDKPVYFFAEVPCIDRVFETSRLSDFFYEHPSQFSTSSFQRLLSRAGMIEKFGYSYGGEVLFALVNVGVPDDCRIKAMEAVEFSCRATANRAAIRAEIDRLATSGKRVAIWGGTGKAAAFIQQYGLDAARFPLVVDSDLSKVGTCVPGTGQLIRSRCSLKEQEVDVVIIPAQWRAQDVVSEMAREGIAVSLVLVEHNGCLVDFSTGNHPYRMA